MKNYFLLALMVVISSCGMGWKNIQCYPTDKLTYDSLPLNVKRVYESFVEYKKLPQTGKRVQSNFFKEKEITNIFLIDTTIILKHFNVSEDATKRMFWPYGHYFKINKKKRFLSYFPSHPDPFVIDGKYIYYPEEFNLISQPYKEIRYYRISY